MEIIWWYLLFAFTTASAAVYELFYPVVSFIKMHRPESLVGQSPKLTIFVSFCVAVIMAPLLLPACLIPSAGVSFRDKFKEVLLKD